MSASKYKHCSRCGLHKLRAEFSKHTGHKDGLQSQCKSCSKAAREAKREYWRAYGRAYRKKHRHKLLAYGRRYRMEHREELRDDDRQYDAAHRLERTAKQKSHRRINPEKHRARLAVQRAKAKGGLVPERCHICGAQEGVHAHHDDYGDQLNVRWLCPSCHSAHHKSLPLETSV